MINTNEKIYAFEISEVWNYIQTVFVWSLISVSPWSEKKLFRYEENAFIIVSLLKRRLSYWNWSILITRRNSLILLKGYNYDRKKPVFSSLQCDNCIVMITCLLIMYRYDNMSSNITVKLTMLSLWVIRRKINHNVPCMVIYELPP